MAPYGSVIKAWPSGQIMATPMIIRRDAAEYTAKMIPGAKLSIYQGVGHSPFFEATPRFNAELGAFVRSAQKGN